MDTSEVDSAYRWRRVADERPAHRQKCEVCEEDGCRHLSIYFDKAGGRWDGTVQRQARLGDWWRPLTPGPTQ